MGFERCSFGLIPWMGHSGPMNSAMPQRTRRKLSSTNGALVSLGGDLEIFLNTYIYIPWKSNCSFYSKVYHPEETTISSMLVDFQVIY